MPITDATSYIWAYSGTGATINGTSNEVSIDFSPNATSGQLTVSGNNSCGNGAASPDFPISLISPPTDADTIAGLHEVCQNTADIGYSTPEINNAASYVWEYSGTGISLLGNSNHVTLYFFNNATSGNLSVYGINDCGSGSHSENFPIIVKSCSENPTTLNIPNSFSPNGDGINDYFYIRGLPAQSNLLIFNRSGKKLYETDNYANDWNGKDMDGKILETGTYWYILVIPGVQGEYKGFVYLKK
jgi:gliding motility-associated-like protein